VRALAGILPGGAGELSDGLNDCLGSLFIRTRLRKSSARAFNLTVVYTKT
jgi:hypothetical protein